MPAAASRRPTPRAPSRRDWSRARRCRRRGTVRWSCSRRWQGERARRANFIYGSSKAGLDAFAQGSETHCTARACTSWWCARPVVRSKMTAGLAEAPMATTPRAVAQAIETGCGAAGDGVGAGTLRVVMSALRHVPRPVFRRLPVCIVQKLRATAYGAGRVPSWPVPLAGPDQPAGRRRPRAERSGLGGERGLTEGEVPQPPPDPVRALLVQGEAPCTATLLRSRRAPRRHGPSPLPRCRAPP